LCLDLHDFGHFPEPLFVFTFFVLLLLCSCTVVDVPVGDDCFGEETVVEELFFGFDVWKEAEVVGVDHDIFE